MTDVQRQAAQSAVDYLIDLRRLTGGNATFDEGEEGWRWACRLAGARPEDVASIERGE